ncbi:MAG: hypothetical protein ACK58T_43375, partial [Phycisphaerae bacterium]
DLPVSIAQTVDQPVDDTLINGLARDAVQQWTGTFNPRKMDAAAFATLYRSAIVFNDSLQNGWKPAV